MTEQLRQNSIVGSKNHLPSAKNDILEVMGKTFKIVPCVKNEIYNFLPKYQDGYKKFSQKVDELHDKLYTFSIDTIMSDDVDFLVLSDTKEIVGYVGLQKNPYALSTIWLTQIAVDEKFSKQGISKKLLRTCLERATQHGMKKFELSAFTALGKQYLPRELSRLQKLYPSIDIYIETEGYEVIKISDYASKYAIFQ